MAPGLYTPPLNKAGDLRNAERVRRRYQERRHGARRFADASFQHGDVSTYLVKARLPEPRSAYWRSGEEEYRAKGSLFPRYFLVFCGRKTAEGVCVRFPEAGRGTISDCNFW